LPVGETECLRPLTHPLPPHREQFLFRKPPCLPTSLMPVVCNGQLALNLAVEGKMDWGADPAASMKHSQGWQVVRRDVGAPAHEHRDRRMKKAPGAAPQNTPIVSHLTPGQRTSTRGNSFYAAMSASLKPLRCSLLRPLVLVSGSSSPWWSHRATRGNSTLRGSARD